MGPRSATMICQVSCQEADCGTTVMKALTPTAIIIFRSPAFLRLHSLPDYHNDILSQIRVTTLHKNVTNSMAYGTRRFNATFHKGPQIIPILSRINPIPLIDTYFFNSKWLLSLPDNAPTIK